MKKIRNPIKENISEFYKDKISRLFFVRHIRYFNLKHRLEDPDSFYSQGLFDADGYAIIQTRMDNIWEGKA